MKIIQKMKRKLKRENGETLAEVMIAVLISTLGLVLLASLITSSVSLITDSKKTFTKYANAQNALAWQSKDTSVNQSLGIEVKNGATIEVHVSVSGSGSSALQITDDAGGNIPVVYYKNETLSHKPVIAYTTNNTSSGSTSTP